MDEFHEINQLLRNGQHSKAISRLVARDGRIRADFRGDVNHAWYLAGDAAYRSGDLDQALVFFKNSARAWPDDTQALMALANCYSDLNKPRWAAHYLAKAIEIDPHNPDLNFNLANARFDMAQYAKAVKLYRKVIKASDSKTKILAAKNLEHALHRLRKPRAPKSLHGP